MVYREVSTNGAEILKRKLGGELFESLTINEAAFSDGVLKAGTPVGADGKVANGASAVGIVLNDVYADRPIATIVKAFAIVNVAAANANAGIEIAEAVKTALPLIYWA